MSAGRLNVTHARLYAEHSSAADSSRLESAQNRSVELRPPQTDAAVRPGRLSKANPLKVEFAEAQLKQQLPIKNGSRFSLPVLVHGAEVSYK